MAFNKDIGDGRDPVDITGRHFLQYSEATMEFREQFLKMMQKETYSFEKFHLASNRMVTFKGWPKSHHISTKKLCEAGFLYIGFDDACMCPWCEVIIDHVSYFEDPLVIHREKAKRCCRYLNYIFPSPLSQEVIQESAVTSSTVDEIGKKIDNAI